MSQSRVSSELVFVISRRHSCCIEFAGAAASPVTHLGLGLQRPDDFDLAPEPLEEFLHAGHLEVQRPCELRRIAEM